MTKPKRITRVNTGLLTEMREKWLAYGLATGESDFDAAKGSIAALHMQIGLKEPRIWITLSSPLHVVIADRLLRKGAQVDAQVYDQVYDQVYAQVHAQVYDQVHAQVDAQVYAQVHAQVYAQVDAQVYAQVDAQVDAQVYAQVHAQVRAQVDAQVYAQVYDQVYDQVYAQVHDQVYAQVYAQVDAQVDAQVHDQVYDRLPSHYTRGQFMAGLNAYFDTYASLGIDSGLTQHLREIGKHISWWTPLGGVCLMVGHPSTIQRDEQGRLHSEDGPAIAWPNWGFWAWHGVRVPQCVIENPGTITAEDILAESNVEVRWVKIQRMGWPRFLQESNAVTVHEDLEGTGHQRALLEVALPGSRTGKGRFLRFVDPAKGETGLLSVPPHLKTCREAAAWTYGISRQEYAGAEASRQ